VQAHVIFNVTYSIKANYMAVLEHVRGAEQSASAALSRILTSTAASCHVTCGKASMGMTKGLLMFHPHRYPEKILLASG